MPTKIDLTLRYLSHMMLSNKTSTPKLSLTRIHTSGEGTYNYNHVNDEAELESIQMLVGAAPNSTFVRGKAMAGGASHVRATLRANARLAIVMVTDEDEDRPTWFENRQR